MNNSLPKWIQIVMALLVTTVALLVFLNHDRMHVYGTYLREKSPEITTRLLDLSTEMDEPQLKKHFEAVSLTCVDQTPESNGLGDRVCYSAIDKADGDAALTLAAFLRQGKLAHVIVQVPWWVHKSRITRLTAQFGQPSRAGLVARFGGPVLRWTLPSGHIDVNRDRSFNVLNWNVILWTGSKVGQGSNSDSH
jgi:hypothetical protein